MTHYLRDRRLHTPSAVSHSRATFDRIASGEHVEDGDLFRALQAAAWKAAITKAPEWVRIRQKFVDLIGERHERLVTFASRRICCRWPYLDLEDIVSAIATRFAPVILAFNPLAGTRFSTYAVNCFMREGYREARKVAERQKNVVAHTETAQVFAVSVARAPTYGAEDIDHLRHVLAANTAELSETERMVVFGRFFDQRKLYQVGETIGLSKERVRQLEKQAIKKLRAVMA